MRPVGELEWRPIVPADVGRWSALMSAIQTADRDWGYFTESDLLEDFGDPDRDFPRASVGVHDGEVMVGWGMLVLRSAAEVSRDIRWEAGVHPAYRGQGIGVGLLDWAEAHAEQVHRTRFADPPQTLTASGLSHNESAMALFAARGFQSVRWFHAMEMDLTDQLPEVEAPPGIDIVGFTPDRSADALFVRNDAFRDHWGSAEMTAQAWAHFVGLGVFRPALSFLAYSDRSPVGVVIGHEYELVNQDASPRDAYVSLVGTCRSVRKRGIASALIRRTLAAARSAGLDTASLSVDAESPTSALGLYERLGFAIEHTSVTVTKSLS